MAGPVYTLIYARGPGPFPSFSFSRIPSPHSNSKAREASIKKWGGSRGGGHGCEAFSSSHLSLSAGCNPRRAPLLPACCCLSPGSPHRILFRSK